MWAAARILAFSWTASGKEMGVIDSASGPDAPIGRAVLGDLAIAADAGSRVVIGTGAAAALIVDATRVSVNSAIGADTLTVGGTASVTGATAVGGALTVTGDAAVTGTTALTGAVSAAGTLTVTGDATLRSDLTLDHALHLTNSTSSAAAPNDVSAHSKYGLRVGNARVVGGGDFLSSVLVADRVYERSEAQPPFQVKASSVNPTAATITMTRLSDPTWTPPANSSFMLEPATPDGTYAVIAVGSVSGQTCNAFVYKSRNQLTPVSLGVYTYTQLVATTVVDSAATALAVDPNAPLSFPVPGYVLSEINPTLTFGGSQVFASGTTDRYFYDTQSEQAFKLLGTNTLQAVSGECRPLEMRSEIIGSTARRTDSGNSDGTITLLLTGTDALTTLLCSGAPGAAGVSTFTAYDGRAVRLEVGGKSFHLQSRAVTAIPSGGATYTQFVVALVDAADALAPELAATTGYVLVTDVGSQPNRGLAEGTVTFSCAMEIRVMEEYVDTFLTFSGGTFTPQAEAAFFSAAITTVVVDGVSYDVVGKDVVVQNVTYRVRLLASQFDSTGLDLGDVTVTLRYQDTDLARAISFQFMCYEITAITAPLTVSLNDVQTAVDFSAGSARMDLTDLLPAAPFNVAPLSPYFRQLQVRESVLHLESTTLVQGALPDVVVDLLYEHGEINVLVNGANTINALLAGVPARLTSLGVNGDYTSAVFERVLDDEDPVPVGSSHVYVYATRALGYYLMRITSRYRDNLGVVRHELLPVRGSPPPWDALRPGGDATVFYVIPFAVKQLYDVGQGGPFSIISRPTVTHAAWTAEADVVPPLRDPRLVVLSEAPLTTAPWRGAPATLLTGSSGAPSYVAETVRPLPPDRDARFPRATYYLHDAEPPDLHTYTFFADLTLTASGGMALMSSRLAPAWSAPGGALQLFFPDDSVPLTVSRADPGTANGVFDAVAGTFTTPLLSGGIFHNTATLQAARLTPTDLDAWAANVRVASDHTVSLPDGATAIVISGVYYTAVNGSVTVPASVPVGAALGLCQGDLLDVTEETLQLPATVDVSTSPPYESVTVPVANRAGGTGTRYLSATVTGSDGYLRHLDVPATGVIRYLISTAPAAGGPATRPAQMHLDSSAKVAGISVLVPPGSGQISGALTGYFKYAGGTTARTRLTPGSPYIATGARTVLTIAAGVRRLTTCIGVATAVGVLTLPAGTSAQLPEGADAYMLEGGLLTGAVLTDDVLSYTVTSETTALLAACPVPGSAAVTLVGKQRMRVSASRLSSVASLTFDCPAGSVPVAGTAAASFVASLALLPILPPIAPLSGTTVLTPYGQLDTLPWATNLSAPLTAGATHRDAGGRATLLLRTTYRGRSWAETTVSVSGGVATLDAAASTPVAACVAVTAIAGAIYAGTVAAGARTFACPSGNVAAAPALLLHARDVMDVLAQDVAAGTMTVAATPVTAARLLAPSVAAVFEGAGETDVVVVVAATVLSQVPAASALGTPLMTLALTVALEDGGARPLVGTQAGVLVLSCPPSAAAQLSKIKDLELMDSLRVGSAIEQAGVLTVGGDTELAGSLHVRNSRGDAVTLQTDGHGVATLRRRNQDPMESIAIATDGAVALRRGVQPRAVQVLSDTRFGTLIPLDGQFTDSALQALRRSTFARDTAASEVRMLPAVPQVDGHTGTYAANAVVGGTVLCGTPAAATCVASTIAFSWSAFGVLPVPGDWVVLSLADGVRRRLLVTGAVTAAATRTLTVSYGFGVTPVTGVIESAYLQAAQTYDALQLGAMTSAAVKELARAFRIVDSTRARFQDLEYVANGVRPVGPGTNEMTVYISDPTTVSAAATSALTPASDADKRLRIGRSLVKSWTNLEVGSDLAQFTTVLHGSLTVGTTKASGSTAGYHATTALYGALTVGEDSTTAQEPTRLYGALTVGATEVEGVTAGHHAATRMYGPLTLGEATTTGQEPSTLNGALTVGASVGTGATAGKHADTALYGKLTVGEATTTAQETTTLNGAVTIGAGEVAGVTAGKHAATVMYGSLTLGEATTTGQEPSTLNGTLTVGKSVGTGAIAGKHANTALYGRLLVGEATTTAQETTTLNGAVTIGAGEVAGVTAGKHAATRVFGALTLGENTTTGQESTLLYGALTVGATEVAGVTAGHHAPVRVYGPLTLGEATTTGQEPSTLNGALTVGASVGTGAIAGKHANTALYGTLTVGEATMSAQETTTLNGAVTVGASKPTGSTAGSHAATVMYGSLTVGEATTTAQEPTTLNGALTVGTQAVPAATQMNGDLTVGQTSDIAKKNTTLNGPLVVATGQATTFRGTVTVGTPALQQTTTLNGALTVGAAGFLANTTLRGTLTVSDTQATALTGTLTVTGATLLSNTLTVTGTTQLNSALTVGTSSTNMTATNLYGSVTVGTSAQLAPVTVNGVLTVAASQATALTGTLTVTGVTLLNNTLTVAGTTQLNSALTVGTSATNMTATNLYGTVTVGTGTQLAPVLINGVLTVAAAQATALTGTLTVTGTTQLNSTLTVAGTTQHNGAVTVGTSGSNTTATNLYGTVTVGTGTQLAPVSINGVLTVAAAQATALTGTLTVTGTTQLNSTLTVSGGATMNGNLSVPGTATTGNTFVSGSWSDGNSGSQNVRDRVNTAYDRGSLGVTNAATAQTAANNAQSSANAAQTSANNAQTTANNAYPKQSGVTISGNDVNVTGSFSDGSSGLQNVRDRINSAYNRGTTAVNDAATAQNTATNAQNTANNAQTTANNAYPKVTGVNISTNQVQAGAITLANTEIQMNAMRLYRFTTSTAIANTSTTANFGFEDDGDISMPRNNSLGNTTNGIKWNANGLNRARSIHQYDVNNTSNVAGGLTIHCNGNNTDFQDDGALSAATNIIARGEFVRSNNRFEFNTSGRIQIFPGSIKIEMSVGGFDQFRVQDNGDIVAKNRVFANGQTATALTFTGFHRCWFHDDAPFDEKMVGLIVVAVDGDYVMVNGNIVRGVAAITISESVPAVRISDTYMDRRVFGVIASEETTREDAYGGFVTPFKSEAGDKRLIVNALGEGAMWVCDAEGYVAAGDYIVSSVVPGYGCRQCSDTLLSCTVAKSTMSCAFDCLMRRKQAIHKEVRTLIMPKMVKSTRKNYGPPKVVDGRYVCDVSEIDYEYEDSVEVEIFDQNGGSIGKQRVTVTEEVETETPVLDEHGRLVWVDALNDFGEPIMEPRFKMRWLTADGTQITADDYADRKAAGEPVYRAAFMGVTYHCG